MARSQLGQICKSHQGPLSKGISPKAQPRALRSPDQGFLDDEDRIQGDPLAEPGSVEPERNLAREGEITFEADGARRYAVATARVGEKWLVIKQRIPLTDGMTKGQQERIMVQASAALRKKVDKAKAAHGVR